MPIVLEHSRHRLLYMWAFLAVKQRSIENSSNKRWTFFHSQSVLSRREDFRVTDMGKSQETKNIIWRKKKKFQGIHVRFFRDHEFRFRMIENHRDEDFCDAFEDHIDHLTEQEYLLCKSKWWLHSNKQGSNTMPLTHRPDSKQALSTLHRLQREAEEDPYVPICSHKHKQLEAQSSSTWWNWQGSWCFLILQKVKKEVSQVLSERWDPFRAVFSKNLTMTLTNSIFLQIDRLQLTAVYCNLGFSS